MKINDQSKLILSSFSGLTGSELVDPNLPEVERRQALFEAPFAVVSHGTEADPIFNYGNKTALELFEMKWDDFIKLPSRLSAEQGTQKERDQLLARVAENGYIDDYNGVRISSTGKRFMVEDAIVWNMRDDDGIYRGQAAILYRWSPL
jgi:hypothetical protein